MNDREDICPQLKAVALAETTKESLGERGIAKMIKKAKGQLAALKPVERRPRADMIKFKLPPTVSREHFQFPTKDADQWMKLYIGWIRTVVSLNEKDITAPDEATLSRLDDTFCVWVAKHQISEKKKVSGSDRFRMECLQRARVREEVRKAIADVSKMGEGVSIEASIAPARAR